GAAGWGVGAGAVRGGGGGARLRGAADAGVVAAPDARPVVAARAPRPPGAARRAGGPPMAGAATVSAASPMGRALDLITRVRGVRGAMVVSRADGLIVAEQLMEGIKGGAVAALASSLAG